jgi:hypothetical protein
MATPLQMISGRVSRHPASAMISSTQLALTVLVNIVLPVKWASHPGLRTHGHQSRRSMVGVAQFMMVACAAVGAAGWWGLFGTRAGADRRAKGEEHWTQRAANSRCSGVQKPRGNTQSPGQERERFDWCASGPRTSHEGSTISGTRREPGPNELPPPCQPHV